MVRLQTIVGPVQVLVAHALASSYPRQQRIEWWTRLADLLALHSDRDVFTDWLLEANLTMESVQSASVGSVHAEEEIDVGDLFHAQLLKWDLAWPATFRFDPLGAGTWRSK